MQGMRSLAPRTASRTASSIDTRSTPGMEETGTRLRSPSTRNNGQIRSSAVNTCSRTIRRTRSDCRLRRGRAVRSSRADANWSASVGEKRTVASSGRPNLIAMGTPSWMSSFSLQIPSFPGKKLWPGAYQGAWGICVLMSRPSSRALLGCLAESQIEPAAAGHRMDSVFENIHAVIGEPRGATPYRDVAMPQLHASDRIVSPDAAEQELGGKSEGDRHDRGGEIRFILVLMQTQFRAWRIMIYETRIGQEAFEAY